jgi:hypothetical protein
LSKEGIEQITRSKKALKITLIHRVYTRDMQASASNEDVFFTQARELFEQIVDWLDSDSVCGLEHGQIENKLLENGYELLRRLLQGYFDKRSSDEIEGECKGSDDGKRTHKKRLSRKLTTIFGTVIVNRIGYGGRKINSLVPLDAPVKSTSRTILPRSETTSSGGSGSFGILGRQWRSSKKQPPQP